MDSKNWFLLLLVLGTISFAAYYINKPEISITRDAGVTPVVQDQVAGYSRARPESWKEFSGDTLKFYYPDKWQPEKRMPYGGSVVEDIKLNIPETVDNNISYSVTSYDVIKPEDLVKEEEFVVNERKWTKWIREGAGYVSYDIYTKDHLLNNEAESFGVHVTLNEKDENLEEELVVLINSIEFSDINATVSPTLSPIE